MANIKITDLTAYGNPTSTDVLPIVDVGADVTKKVSVADLLENAGSGTEALPGIAFDGDPDTGIYSPGADQLAVSTNGAGRLFIDSSGNVGLGTSSPGANLDVRGATNVGGAAIVSADANINEGALGIIGFYNTNANASSNPLRAYITSTRQNSAWGADLQFFTSTGSAAATSKVMINEAGSVGIGTTSPQVNLDIAPATSSAILRVHARTNTSSVPAIELMRGASTTFGADIYGDYRIKGESGELILEKGTDGLTSEVLRTDGTSLLVGTSSALSNVYALTAALSPKVQIEESDATAHTSIIRTAGGGGSYFTLGWGSSGNVATTGQDLGVIQFNGFDGANYRNSASIICEADDAHASGDTPGRLVFSTTADGVSSPTEQLRITSDRYIRLASGTGGIQFNGDTAGANALDDYEEGTWTPALAFGGGSTGITYGSRAGYYTKIGKQVFLTLYFNLSSKGTDTGSATVTGLPFTSEDFNISGTLHWPGSIPSRRQNQTSTNFAMMVLENTATIACTNGVGIALTDTNFTDGTIIECFLSYRAA